MIRRAALAAFLAALPAAALAQDAFGPLAQQVGQGLGQNAVLLGLLVLTIMIVVQRVTRAVREVGHAIGQRPRHNF